MLSKCSTNSLLDPSWSENTNNELCEEIDVLFAWTARTVNLFCFEGVATRPAVTSVIVIRGFVTTSKSACDRFSLASFLIKLTEWGQQRLRKLIDWEKRCVEKLPGASPSFYLLLPMPLLLIFLALSVYFPFPSVLKPWVSEDGLSTNLPLTTDRQPCAWKAFKDFCSLVLAQVQSFKIHC